MILLYCAWDMTFGRRGADELSSRKAGGLPAGFAWGALLVGASVAPSVMLGAYTVTAIRWPPTVLADVAFWVFVAVGQEMAFRGLLLRVLQNRFGAAAAVTISSAAFGAFHLINPHATAWAAIALGLESVGAYALPYLLSRNLWLVVGVHLGWNFTEATLLGAPDSGQPYSGILVPHISGPDWLTGGAFGPEASLPAVAVCAASGLLILASVRLQVIRVSHP